MPSSFKIFIVDDDPVSRMIVADELADKHYQLHEFATGEEALAALELAPDLILLDVEMPGIGGHETCRRVKKDPASNHINVIFISSHDSVEEKLAGYDAGGSDYIIKPVQAKELHQKIELAVKNKQIRTASVADKNEAMQIAMTAMTNAGELGVVLDFMRRSFSISSVQALAELIVEAFSQFNVDSSVQLRTSKETITTSNKLPTPPLEIELLTRLKDSGRIMESGPRLIANFGEISLLIKNMPEDEDQRGRLRDHLAILLEGAEARLRVLQMELGMTHLVHDSKQALKAIEVMQQQQKKNAMQIMDGLMHDVEKTFLSYGLSEDQEALLIKLVQDGVDRSLENFEQGLKIDEQMHTIIRHMERFGAK